MKSFSKTILVFVLFLMPFTNKAFAQVEPYLGQIMLFAGDFTPLGWKECNGQLLSVKEYSALFSILGTTYGGDGVTTFALPDLRGRVPIGVGNAPGLSNYSKGEAGGTESTTLQLPPRSHNGVAISKGTSLGAASSTTTTIPIAIDNRQPYLAMKYVIAVQGVYPSRD